MMDYKKLEELQNKLRPYGYTIKDSTLNPTHGDSQPKKVGLDVKLHRIAIYGFMIHILLYIGYNTYFGWNTEPINRYQELWDVSMKSFRNLLFVLYILPIFRMFENKVKEL